MSCNCKSVKRIDKILDKPLKGEKIGVFERISHMTYGIITKIMVTILIILLIPLVALTLIWNYTFNGGLMFKVPNFIINYIKKHKNEREKL